MGQKNRNATPNTEQQLQSDVGRAARYQTAHLLIGFIELPLRQLNALANSGKFITDALTLTK